VPSHSTSLRGAVAALLFIFAALAAGCANDAVAPTGSASPSSDWRLIGELSLGDADVDGVIRDVVLHNGEMLAVIAVEGELGGEPDRQMSIMCDG
jgi:hypothetical protein